MIAIATCQILEPPRAGLTQASVPTPAAKVYARNRERRIPMREAAKDKG